MENKLFITTMNQAHVEQVYKIENKLISVPWSKKLLEELVEQKNAIARVLLIDNQVIGYYSLYKICDEADINNLAISTEFQGKGYGKALMLDIINECKKANLSSITLEVASNNVRALSLYESVGFKIEGNRKNYYNEGVDALIMWYRF